MSRFHGGDGCGDGLHEDSFSSDTVQSDSEREEVSDVETSRKRARNSSSGGVCRDEDLPKMAQTLERRNRGYHKELQRLRKHTDMSIRKLEDLMSKEGCLARLDGDMQGERALCREEKLRMKAHVEELECRIVKLEGELKFYRDREAERNSRQCSETEIQDMIRVGLNNRKKNEDEKKRLICKIAETKKGIVAKTAKIAACKEEVALYKQPAQRFHG